MTKFNLDLEKIIKEAIKDAFDEDVFLEKLAIDIEKTEPSWWAEKIIKPLRSSLEESILKNETFIKSVIWEYMDREFYDHLKGKFNILLREYVDEKVNKAMPKLKITVENKKND